MKNLPENREVFLRIDFGYEEIIRLEAKEARLLLCGKLGVEWESTTNVHGDL